MLIQTRDKRIRLFRQHDHGLLAGELADAWRGGKGDEPLDRVLVLATALHDLGWRELDEVPVLDPDTGRPYDFLTLPAEAKFEAAAEAIDRIQELHPYAAVLVSLHYQSLGAPHRPAEFDEEEEARRVEILDDLGDEAPGPRRIRADVEMLQLFDNLSLFLCLTPPGADAVSRPSWLRPELLRIPDAPGPSGDGVAGGSTIDLEWLDEETAMARPFPFGGRPVSLELPCRELDRTGFPDQEALAAAWAAADERTVTLRIVAGDDSTDRKNGA